MLCHRQLNESTVQNAEMDGFLLHLQNEQKEALIKEEPGLHAYSIRDVDMWVPRQWWSNHALLKITWHCLFFTRYIIYVHLKVLRYTCESGHELASCLMLKYECLFYYLRLSCTAITNQLITWICLPKYHRAKEWKYLWCCVPENSKSCDLEFWGLFLFQFLNLIFQVIEFCLCI